MNPIQTETTVHSNVSSIQLYKTPTVGGIEINTLIRANRCFAAAVVVGAIIAAFTVGAPVAAAIAGGVAVAIIVELALKHAKVKAIEAPFKEANERLKRAKDNAFKTTERRHQVLSDAEQMLIQAVKQLPAPDQQKTASISFIKRQITALRKQVSSMYTYEKADLHVGQHIAFSVGMSVEDFNTLMQEVRQMEANNAILCEVVNEPDEPMIAVVNQCLRMNINAKVAASKVAASVRS